MCHAGLLVVLMMLPACLMVVFGKDLLFIQLKSKEMYCEYSVYNYDILSDMTFMVDHSAIYTTFAIIKPYNDDTNGGNVYLIRYDKRMYDQQSCWEKYAKSLNENVRKFSFLKPHLKFVSMPHKVIWNMVMSNKIFNIIFGFINGYNCYLIYNYFVKKRWLYWLFMGLNCLVVILIVWSKWMLDYYLIYQNDYIIINTYNVKYRTGIDAWMNMMHYLFITQYISSSVSLCLLYSFKTLLRIQINGIKLMGYLGYAILFICGFFSVIGYILVIIILTCSYESHHEGILFENFMWSLFQFIGALILVVIIYLQYRLNATLHLMANKMMKNKLYLVLFIISIIWIIVTINIFIQDLSVELEDNTNINDKIFDLNYHNKRLTTNEIPYFQDKSIIMVGLIRNGEQNGFNTTLNDMNEIGCIFNNAIFIILESNSNDTTPQMLQQWKQEPLNCESNIYKITIIGENKEIKNEQERYMKLLNRNYLDRIEKYTILRNYLLNQSIKYARSANFIINYFSIIDLDSYGFDKAMFFKELYNYETMNKNDNIGFCGNGIVYNGYTYDTYAMITTDNKWRWTMTPSRLISDWHYPFNRFEEMKSCFGGIIIYNNFNEMIKSNCIYQLIFDRYDINDDPNIINKFNYSNITQQLLINYANIHGKRTYSYPRWKYTYNDVNREHHICEHLSFNICLNYRLKYKFIISKYSYLYRDPFKYYSFNQNGSIKYKYY